MSRPIRDGNACIAEDIPALIGMVARSSLWVSPETFRALPVWAPWAARGMQVYDKGWTTPASLTRKATGVAAPKRETNVAAIDALIRALGVGQPRPKNWTVCHIWGYDDPAFASASSPTHDPRFFTCVANMIWLPTPLKGLTDAVPEVKAVLRTCAAHLYGWRGPGDAEQDGVPACYPSDWPTPERPGLHPVGLRPLTDDIRLEIAARKRRIAADLADPALLRYPRQQVQGVLRYWNVELAPPAAEVSTT